MESTDKNLGNLKQRLKDGKLTPDDVEELNKLIDECQSIVQLNSW
ncbi:MAG: hypothetical protein WB014_06125 [Methanosarcina sp.]